MVNIGSLEDMFFLSILHAFGVKDEEVIRKNMPLLRFNNRTMHTMGTIKVPIMAKESMVMTNFIVVDTLVHYILILGRPWTHKMKVVFPTYH